MILRLSQSSCAGAGTELVKKIKKFLPQNTRNNEEEQTKKNRGLYVQKIRNNEPQLEQRVLIKSENVAN